VTGPKSRIEEGRTVVNRGVQCEACHGAAAAHAADPAVKTGLTKVPGTAVCESCHSDKGPHFKGFFYGAMAGLSHRVS
jgi:predicted CXXCH cytochrome family protein